MTAVVASRILAVGTPRSSLAKRPSLMLPETSRQRFTIPPMSALLHTVGGDALVWFLEK